MERIAEDYIQYIWQYGLFDASDLKTTKGEPITVIDRGFINHDSGPDFSNGRIRIGEQEWAGTIEIHFKSSDWDAHSHDLDEAYDNVILHVVMLHDREILNKRGATIPTLSLSSRFELAHLDSYRELINSKEWVPCQSRIGRCDPFVVSSMKQKALVERAEQKSRRLLDVLEIVRGDWDKTLYTALAMAFGGKVNAEPFGLLSRLTPMEVVARHTDDREMLEALFIGQAGYLQDDFEDDYPRALQENYRFMQKKYRLSPMKSVAWKNSRLRPSSLPLIRIAQFARLWEGRRPTFSTMLTAEIEELEEMFSITLDGYWLEHYSFDKPSGRRAKSFGENSIHGLVINTVVPLLFAHGVHVGDLNSKERAVYLLEKLPSEDNKVIRQWQSLGIASDTAFDSQALLQQKKHWCAAKRCLSCPIGVKLMKQL